MAYKIPKMTFFLQHPLCIIQTSGIAKNPVVYVLELSSIPFIGILVLVWYESS